MDKIDLYMEAVHILRPNSKYSMVNDTIDVWLDTEQSQPTDAEIQAEISRLQAEYDSNQYQRDRARAYPPIGDQLDMIYHAGLGGDAFQAAISAVKQEYPK